MLHVNLLPPGLIQEPVGLGGSQDGVWMQEVMFNERLKLFISHTEHVSCLQAPRKTVLACLKAPLELLPFHLTLWKLESEMIGGRRPISKFINKIKPLSSNHLCELDFSPFVTAITACQGRIKQPFKHLQVCSDLRPPVLGSQFRVSDGHEGSSSIWVVSMQSGQMQEAAIHLQIHSTLLFYSFITQAPLAQVWSHVLYVAQSPWAHTHDFMVRQTWIFCNLLASCPWPGHIVYISLYLHVIQKTGTLIIIPFNTEN